MEYRREIDGLRAVAVLPVIFFHAGFPLFSGGYVGVDVFFVISGYLITSIIINDLENDRFSLARFYERRARRILPALFFVMLCCIPFAWMWMLPQQLGDFSQALVAISLFASNVLWRESDYFAPAAEENPLLHTWSLAVEEQFYVLFPIMLILLWRFGKNPVFYTILGLSVVSLLLSEWGWRNRPSENFYLLPARAWELGAGAICALALHDRGRKPHPWSSSLLSVVGLGLILYSIFFYDEGTPFPSIYTLLPVIGTALIILYGHHETIAARMISRKIFVGLGLISFSAYLWHQPLFAFSRIHGFNQPSWLEMAALSALALVLAALSWKYVEQPCRTGTFIATRRRVLIASVGFTALLVAAGTYGHVRQGLKWRLEKPVVDLAEAVNDKSAYYDCQSEPNEIIGIEEACILGDKKNVAVALLGDSHASALSQGLAEVAGRNGLGIRMLSFSGCVAVAGLEPREKRGCHDFNERNFEYIKASGIDYVIMSSRWSLHYHGTRFDNDEGGKEYGGDLEAIPTGKTFDSQEERKRLVLERYSDAVEQYRDAGIGVILVWDVPEAGWNVPRHLARVYMVHGELRPESGSTSHDVYNQRTADVSALFSSIEPRGPAAPLLHVKPDRLLCNTVVPGRCITHENGEPLYFDDNHLSNKGALPLSEKIVQALEVHLNRA